MSCRVEATDLALLSIHVSWEAHQIEKEAFRILPSNILVHRSMSRPW
jgi:hypothetical protein